MSNSHGSYYSTSKNFYKAFDRLPKKVRQRFSLCNQDWVAQPLVTALRRREKRRLRPSQIEFELLNLIEKFDEEDRKEHFARIQRQIDRGINYERPLRRKRK